MKIKTIFLDMDGVLVNFNKAVCERFELPYPPQTYHFFPAIREDVNAFCTSDFWRNLEWTLDGQEILRAIMNTFGLDKVHLLSGMMPNVGSGSGKLMWIRDNLPVYSNRTILHTLGASKSLLAQPDTLLIDDKDGNVEDFIEAGGQGILVPRPYNRLHKLAGKSSRYVEKSLKDLLC